MKKWVSFLLLCGTGLFTTASSFAEEPKTHAEGSAPQCHVSPAGEPPATEKPLSNDIWPAQTDVPVEMRDGVSPGGGKVKTIVFKNMLIDRIYPSMRGPWTRKFMAFDTPESHVWVRKYRAEVLDGATGSASQEFMCHTNFDLAGAAGQPNAFQRVRSALSISQGQKEIVFPKGYALRLPSDSSYQNDVNVMILNNSEEKVHKSLDFKVTIDYLEDKVARQKKLTPLTQFAAGINCPTVENSMNNGDTVCEPASKFLVSAGGDQRTGHWLIGPGRHSYTNRLQNLVSQDTRVHYIWMHVHPYAESMELRDLTTGQRVWSGAVKNAPGRPVILDTEFYSSSKGLTLYKDHTYELVATYNNRTDRKIDAMAALWMYMREPS